MRRIHYATEIIESESALLALERNQVISRFRDYVRFIRYLKTGEASSQHESGAKIGLQGRQSQNLWRRYKTEGFAGLLTEQRGGSVGYLSYVQLSHLQSYLRQSTVVLTQVQVAEWIAATFGVQYTQSGISDLFQRLKIKLKTGRPVSIRQDKWAIADFKKTSLRPLPE